MIALDFLKIKYAVAVGNLILDRGGGVPTVTNITGITYRDLGDLMEGVAPDLLPLIETTNLYLGEADMARFEAEFDMTIRLN